MAVNDLSLGVSASVGCTASEFSELFLLQLLAAMDADHSGQVSCDEFLQFCLNNPVLMRPPLLMQYVLRRGTFGS